MNNEGGNELGEIFNNIEKSIEKFKRIMIFLLFILCVATVIIAVLLRKEII